MNSQATNENNNKFQPPPPPMRINRADANPTQQQQQQQQIPRSAPNTQPPRRHNGSQRQQGRGSPNDSRHYGAAGSKGRGRGGFPRVGRNNNGSGHFPTGGGINLGGGGGGGAAASNSGNMGGRGLSFHHDSQHRGLGVRQYSPMRQFMGGRGGGGPPPPPPPPPPPQHLRMGITAASGTAPTTTTTTNAGFMDQRNMYPPMQVGNNIPRTGMPYHQPPPPPPPPPPSHQKQYPQVPFSQQQQQAQPQYNLNQSNLPMMQSTHPTFGGPSPTGQFPPPFTPTMTQSMFQPPFPQTPYPMQQQQQQQQQPQPMHPLHPISQHGAMGPITTTTTTAATTAISNTPTNPNDVITNWSIHKGTNGIDFYHNSVTGESTFTRPSCLGPGSSVTTVHAGSTTTVGKKRSWTQHMDPATGRVFYYDGTVTTWEKPQGFQEDTASIEGSDEKDQPPNKKRKKKKEESSVVLYNNKAEAIAAFKGLLLAKDILPTMKWNEVEKICSADQRWEACSTVGERKQALAEYQTKRANELREEKRQEKVRAKDAFMKLLTDVLPTIRAFDASNNTSFHEIRDYLSKDDRFHAVEEEESREELYLDFVEEIRKRDERQKRTKKRDAKTAFIAFLKGKEESGALTYASTWQTFVSSLDENDTVDSRFVVSPHMSDQERQLYFADHVIELQVIEDEKRRRIRDARRRAEKAQRDAFRETLTNMAKEGMILPSSRWRNIEDMLASEESFKAVREQGRNEPQLIFDDYIDEWADIYQGDKAFLSDLLSKSQDHMFQSDSKYEDFTKVLLDAAAPSPDSYRDVRRIIQEELPVSSAKLLFDEIIAVEKASKIRNRSSGRRITDDSSEDEGEIVEDGEVTDEVATPAASST